MAPMERPSLPPSVSVEYMVGVVRHRYVSLIDLSMHLLHLWRWDRNKKRRKRPRIEMEHPLYYLGMSILKAHVRNTIPEPKGTPHTVDHRINEHFVIADYPTRVHELHAFGVATVSRFSARIAMSFGLTHAQLPSHPDRIGADRTAGTKEPLRGAVDRLIGFTPLSERFTPFTVVHLVPGGYPCGSDGGSRPSNTLASECLRGADTRGYPCVHGLGSCVPSTPFRG